MTEGKRRSSFIEPDPGLGKVIIEDGHIVGIEMVEDEGGAQGFVSTDTGSLITNHDDLQNYAHPYDRRIYSEECKCGREKYDAIHGNLPSKPDPDTEHPFARRDYSPLCECGKPLWEAVHDVYKWEEDPTND